jgi:hypothetical protein
MKENKISATVLVLVNYANIMEPGIEGLTKECDTIHAYYQNLFLSKPFQYYSASLISKFERTTFR